ncbi:DUF3105 domain-containing protein [Streptomyces sp. NBC_01023]|uniref:DUF3105 domain-containing protein n=1 Tax=Streptomyces sp. NBC_01023 TaxID=2903724 RepID=UPI00386892C8|nr:DUF3105 domain-containing protein [Streptomyces sp. NBC_01023]
MASTQGSKNDRKTRIEEMRRAERSRERRIRIAVITVAAVAVAGLVGFGTYLVSNSPGSDSTTSESKASDSTADGATTAGPIKGEKDWDIKKLGRTHVTTKVTYPMTPPVGGNHNQVWMDCNGNVYTKPLPDMNAVHSLEHGSVWVTYTDKAPAADVKKLGAKVSRTPYSLMSPYPGQSGAIMLSAWGKQVTVDGADDPRVNQFFTKYVQGPQTPEPGAACTGGLDGQ